MPNLSTIRGGVGFGQTFATSTYGTTVTAGAANVKGTAVELIAATSFDAHWIEVMAFKPSAGAAFAVDILTGSATEDVTIPDLTLQARQTNEGGARWLFPIFIPKGTRIAARLASSSASATCLVAVALFNAGIGAGGLASKVSQYGTISLSRGVNLDPGAVAHTDGAATQMTAATAFDHHWLVVTVLNPDAAYAGTTKDLIDVLIGSATEQVLLGDWPLGGAGTADVRRPDNTFHAPVYIPKGSRLSMRHRSSSTTDVDRDLYVTLHGC
jgi:hypothetical protein